MSTTPQPTPRAAGEAVKAFREYLTVHPDACTRMGGHAMDDMALDLARIALDFAAEPAPAPAPSDDLTKRLIAACRHTTLTWEDRRAVGEAIARLQAAMVSTPAPVPTDAQLLALNEGERYFSESPSKYPEAGFGTQYHGGAPGVLQFARAVLALGAV